MIFLQAIGALLLGATASAATPSTPSPPRYFVVKVVDDTTNRGIPLVELRTPHLVRYVSDSAGVIAMDEPGLEGQETFFHVSSPGYEVPADGFGYRGVRLRVKAGETARIRMKRLSIAERLYRITGEGIYRDSALAGLPVPPGPSLLNAQVVGQDTVDQAVYHGKLFWIWGDTSRLSYPLGNFHTTAATSPLPGDGGLNPSQGIRLTYFTNKDGFTREMTPFSETGPTWIDGLTTLTEDGRERLFTLYANVRGDMSVVSRGLGRFNDDEGRFEKVAEFPMASPILPRGHAFKARQNGTDYIFFASAYPLVRVKANAADLRDPSRYEAFTPLQAGSRFDPGHPEAAPLDRDTSGRLRYAWKPNTSPVDPDAQERLIAAGTMKPEEALLRLQNPDTAETVYAHGGSVYWNAYRKRWVMITTQRGGSASNLGEVWYAEAETPVGPWNYARKIATHNKTSFYNPKQDPFFDEKGGQLLYFEGTYTFTFSGTEEAATPRYDYNQMMYRLDLSDPRLTLPAPVHPLPWAKVEGRPAPFCAPDRRGPGLVPAFWEAGTGRLSVGAARDADKAGAKVLFYALPANAEKPSPATLPLYEWTRDSDGARVYSTDADARPIGYRREPQPVCRVWRNPCPVDLSGEAATAQR